LSMAELSLIADSGIPYRRVADARWHDAVVVTDAEDSIISPYGLSADDRAAVGWAISSEHPLGMTILERVRSGVHGGRVPELADLHHDWDRAGRPPAAADAHRLGLAAGTPSTRRMHPTSAAVMS